MRFTRILRNIGARYAHARDTLNIEVGSTNKEIHAAYLKLAKMHHPDIASITGRDPKEAEKKFQEIGEAYQLLIATMPKVDDTDVSNPGPSRVQYCQFLIKIQIFDQHSNF